MNNESAALASGALTWKIKKKKKTSLPICDLCGSISGRKFGFHDSRFNMILLVLQNHQCSVLQDSHKCIHMLYFVIFGDVFFFFILCQNLQGLTGTPLVAGSPIRHESTVQGNPVEVQTYQPPWKALSEFALQSDLDQPAFQQLVCVFRTD